MSCAHKLTRTLSFNIDQKHRRNLQTLITHIILSKTVLGLQNRAFFVFFDTLILGYPTRKQWYVKPYFSVSFIILSNFVQQKNKVSFIKPVSLFTFSFCAAPSDNSTTHKCYLLRHRGFFSSTQIWCVPAAKLICTILLKLQVVPAKVYKVILLEDSDIFLDECNHTLLSYHSGRAQNFKLGSCEAHHCVITLIHSIIWAAHFRSLHYVAYQSFYAWDICLFCLSVLVFC